MHVSPLLAGGLLLALLSARLEAKPASQLPQKVRQAAARPGGAPRGRGGHRGRRQGASPWGGGVLGPSLLLRPIPGTTPGCVSRAPRPDPPARRHKGLHKKGLGKGCFGLKLDRIGAMSGLGC
uniref:Natriuretic peptide C n=1 Tax=Dromaius novaehollandiae TaxID=8790 RepID=A0A8C4KI36_DRONO